MVDTISKKSFTRSLFPPMDFYRFKHHTELAESALHKKKLMRHLWIVGESPFDGTSSPDEGHVVHLGTPSFTARWTMVEETIAQIAKPDFLDEDTNILIYETIMTGGINENIDEWLMEAANAVAYCKGLIAIAEPVINDPN